MATVDFDKKLEEWNRGVVRDPDFTKVLYGSEDPEAWVVSGVMGTCKAKELQEAHEMHATVLVNGSWRITTVENWQKYMAKRGQQSMARSDDEYLKRLTPTAAPSTTTPFQQSLLPNE